MDHADVAGDTVDHCTADAVARQMGKSAPETHPDFDGWHCVECCEPIHPARLALGKVRCLGCQVDLEESIKMRPYNVTVQ